METNNAIMFELIDAGLDVNTCRFPYTYHHDYVRRSDVSRENMARKLRDVCVDMNEYDYSACYGAILYLISEQPEIVSPEICDTLRYVKDRSVYDVDGICGRDLMRHIIGL